MWSEELSFVRRFADDLERRPSLPMATGEEFEEHSRQAQHLLDVLSCFASLAAPQRPPVAPWDDVVAPLWRRLFAKGDDISRYLLADIWGKVLTDAGEVDRALRTTIGAVASARNFYLFEEGLERCAAGRAMACGHPSVNLAQLINVEGSVHYFRGDLEAAERSYTEALTLAEPLPPEDFPRWIGASKADFEAQERFNVLETYLDRGTLASPSERGGWVDRARGLMEELDRLDLSGGFGRFRAVAATQLAVLKGDYEGAREVLAGLTAGGEMEGPYRYSLLTTQCRLEARICQMEGDWIGAYQWVRRALKEGLNFNFPAEEQLILDQAIATLKGLDAVSLARPEKTLVADIVSLLEDKDWYTGRSHSRSVGNLATRVGEALNAEGAGLDLDVLHMAGLLHDVGKLRCPWSLLNKIAPISPKERLLLHKHAEFGGEILRAIGMDHVASIVEQHHEAVDGAGYPRGVCPPLPAAIIGLCDTYEASVSANRRYKKPKTREEALSEISALRGTRFHPEAVDGLLKVMAHPEPVKT